jgi:hypothetical protein
MSPSTVPLSSADFVYRQVLAEAHNTLVIEHRQHRQRVAAMHAAERERLNQEQRIDRAQIEADDAEENERQVRALEAWLAQQGQAIEKGGVL